MTSFLRWMRDACGRNECFICHWHWWRWRQAIMEINIKVGHCVYKRSSFFSCGWFLFFKPVEAISILWQIMKGCRFPYLPLQWKWCPFRDLLCFSVFDNWIILHKLNSVGWIVEWPDSCVWECISKERGN
jgi:hypothetical protein